MRFYNRERETHTLQSIENMSAEYAQMTVITGRRRIGKTTLIRHAFKRLPLIYFFVGRKSEAMLCRELTEIVKNVLGDELGTFTSMSALFSSLMNISKQKNFTLVFDEFQNFSTVNASSFRHLPHLCPHPHAAR